MNAYQVQKLIALLRLKEMGQFNMKIPTEKRWAIVEGSSLSVKTVDRLCNAQTPFGHKFGEDTLNKLTTYLGVDSTWLHFCENNPPPFSQEVPEQGKVTNEWQQMIKNQLRDELSDFNCLSDYLRSRDQEKRNRNLVLSDNTNFKFLIKTVLRKHYGAVLSIKQDQILTGARGKKYEVDFLTKMKGDFLDQQVLIKCAFFEGEGNVTQDFVDSFFNHWHGIGLEVGRFLVISNRTFSKAAEKKMLFHHMALCQIDADKELVFTLKMHDSKASQLPIKFYTLLPFRTEESQDDQEIKKIILKEYFDNIDQKYVSQLALSLREGMDILLS